MNKFLFLVLLLSFLAGCTTFTPQQITLNPNVTVAESAAGLGKVVALRVSDARTDPALGYRTTRSDKDSAIISNQNLAKLVEQKTYDALRKNSFDITTADSGSRALKVEIRNLEYTVPTGSWINGINILAAFDVTAKNGDITYQNLYEIKNTERVLIKPDQEKNEALINKALSDVLQRMLQDQKLMALLAK
ncbi:MAG: YajG family lipoprotein [Burkholderiales bacterium]